MLFPVGSKKFIREQCLAYTQKLLDDGKISRNHPFFFRDANGIPLSSRDDPFLTLEGCHALCGTGIGWFVDMGPRLTTWLIPGQ